MRILLLSLALALTAGACAKKPAPQTPANKAGEMNTDSDKAKAPDATDTAKPDDTTEPTDPKASEESLRRLSRSGQGTSTAA